MRVVSRPDLDFISPNFAIVEVFKHAPRIQEKSKLLLDEILNLLAIILESVKLLDHAVIGLGNWVEASRLCREVDPADLPFVALCLQFKA